MRFYYTLMFTSLVGATWSHGAASTQMQARALAGESAYYNRLEHACGQTRECGFAVLPDDTPDKLAAMRATFKCMRQLDLKEVRVPETCSLMVLKMQRDYAHYATSYAHGKADEAKLAAAHETYYSQMVVQCPSVVDRCHLAALPEHDEWTAMKAKFACMKTLDLRTVHVGRACRKLVVAMQTSRVHGHPTHPKAEASKAREWMHVVKGIRKQFAKKGPGFNADVQWSTPHSRGYLEVL